MSIKIELIVVSLSVVESLVDDSDLISIGKYMPLLVDFNAGKNDKNKTGFKQVFKTVQGYRTVSSQHNISGKV